jgi:predicted pyridoxine 5'-phosphate oxidase superfamily flavin-nucleotide-binding protein
MAKLPDAAAQAWENRKGPAVLTTVDSKGIPNTIYVSCVKKISDDQIVIADNRMNKTRANILAGGTASLLYPDGEKNSYQLKGSLEHKTHGEIFEQMKNGWLDKKYPGRAAVVFHIEEVYSGAEKLA